MAPDVARIFTSFRPFCKTDARCRRLPHLRQPERWSRGLIWPFSPWHSDRLFPSAALERMSIGRLTLALVVAAAAVPSARASGVVEIVRPDRLGAGEPDR